jgi:hypothetical protein
VIKNNKHNKPAKKPYKNSKIIVSSLLEIYINGKNMITKGFKSELLGFTKLIKLSIESKIKLLKIMTKKNHSN